MTTPTKIDQRYEVVKNLGGGLSGEVMLIKDGEELRALKFLKKIQLNVSREEALTNFKNEFAILKELNHPNIARIIDFGFEAKLQKYYFTTEFIQGAELHVACENQSVEVIERLVLQILRALNYLHTRGIYHFDIKPQNVLVSFENNHPVNAKIIDFGLAGFTSPRKKVGTPAYMAPEVIQGGVLDGRTDLYSFGVLLFKVLTGTNPFQSNNLKEILNNHLHLVPPAPSQIRPDLPKYWDHIIARLLEKNPVNRYSQASLVIRDLNFLSNKTFEVETKDTKLSYLPEKGTLIGREGPWEDFTDLFAQAFLSDTLPEEHTLIVEGQKGTGKTRLLNEIKYFSQLRNVPVKSITQFQNEEKPASYILLIDDPGVDADQVNTLLQQTTKDKCLVVWACQTAPRNWANTRVISLANYDKAQLKAYLESVTGLSQAPERLIDEVFSRTQGNPLFVTEFIKLLLDNNLLFDSSGKWDATTFEDIKIDFDRIHIPSSVEDILLERYRKLPPPLQEICRWLSVHGHELNISDLENLTHSEHLPAQILNLINEDVIEKTSREHTYYFKNLLFATVVCKLIPAKELPLFHDRLADLLENRPENHLSQLYHRGHGSEPATARQALKTLGENFTTKAQYEKALPVLEKLATLSQSLTPAEQISAYFSLGKAYFLGRHQKEAIATYSHIKDNLANKNNPNDIETILLACDKLTEASLKLGEMEQTKKFIAEATALLPVTLQHQKLHETIFRNHLAHIHIKMGEIDNARTLYLQTQKTWMTDLTEDEKLRVSNNRLVEVYLINKEFDKAIEVCEENIAYLKTTGVKFELAMNHYALGDIYQHIFIEEQRPDRNQIAEKCVANLHSCEKLSREINDYGLMLRAFNGLGNLFHHKKDLEKALDYYKRALAASRQAEELLAAAFISYNIGNILKREQQYQDSYSYLIYTINTLEGLSGKFSPHREDQLFISYLLLSEVFLCQGDCVKSHKALDSAQKVFEENEYLKHREFWKQVRRAEIYVHENNQKMADFFLAKANTLIQTEEHKEEFGRVQKVFQDKMENTPEKKATGAVIMTQTPPPTTSDGLKKIIEINRLINSEHNTDHLLKLVLNYAIQLSNAESGFVLLLDTDGNFVIKSSLNTSTSDEEKISMSIAKMAIESGEIVQSSDALSDNRFDASESIVLNELKSVLCLPICSKFKSIGVFYLDNRYRTNAFANCDVNLLKAFCDQVGIALENSELVTQLLSAQKQLEQRLEKTTEELTEVKNILKEESETYKTRYAYTNIVAKSRPMQEIFKLLDKITETSLSIFIHGSSGTGKELVAKALHYNNPARTPKRFVAINCGAIPATLMESELFGHKAGSFTGANKDKKGLFEEANGGTLLLDEIGELDMLLQVKLLRVLQEGEVQRIGDTHVIKVDVRVLCASNKDLATMVKQGQFREDLYYRLCQMKIELPPLSERPEDIPLLSKHFVEKYREQNKIRDSLHIPPVFMKALLEYQWPGNIRELENLILVACALSENNELKLANIPPNYGLFRQMPVHATNLPTVNNNLADITAPVSGVAIDEKNAFDPRKTWADYEALIITKCYEANNKKKIATAESLAISHSTVYKKVSELSLDDSSNALYAEPFVYDGHTTMRDYVVLIFAAAYKHHNSHPYAAIRQLGVSQGYFYKIMKEFKGCEAVVEEAKTD